jgi:hypothetical protein
MNTKQTDKQQRHATPYNEQHNCPPRFIPEATHVPHPITSYKQTRQYYVMHDKRDRA